MAYFNEEIFRLLMCLTLTLSRVKPLLKFLSCKEIPCGNENFVLFFYAIFHPSSFFCSICQNSLVSIFLLLKNQI
jgi:hypothetical protein